MHVCVYRRMWWSGYICLHAYVCVPSDVVDGVHMLACMCVCTVGCGGRGTYACMHVCVYHRMWWTGCRRSFHLHSANGPNPHPQQRRQPLPHPKLLSQPCGDGLRRNNEKEHNWEQQKHTIYGHLNLNWFSEISL